MLAQIVLYDSVDTHGVDLVRACIQSLLDQSGWEAGKNLSVQVLDNGSSRDPFPLLQLTERPGLKLISVPHNLGFCGANNAAAFTMVEEGFDYLLLLNPDCLLEPQALQELVKALESDAASGSACPRLLTLADDGKPATIDSTGIQMYNSLRHLDRGAGQADQGQYKDPEYVFGGSGACLLLKRKFVEDLALPETEAEAALYAIYPQLEQGRSERLQIFDEAFFAYREDADLAWRAQALGWSCKYVPAARGLHKRVVKPEKRAELDRNLNLLGVRNRFLLQINNYHPSQLLKTILPGLLFRNLLVVLAVLLKEQSSLAAFRQLWQLLPRSLELRSFISQKAGHRPVKSGYLSKWFRS